MTPAAKRKKHKQHIVDAADAHTRLNIFYAVIGLMEGGHLPGGSDTANKTAETIIAFCRREAGRQLDDYDFHVAAALSQTNVDADAALTRPEPAQDAGVKL